MREQGLKVCVPNMSPDGMYFDEIFKIIARKNDRFMTICHEGMNRSQISHVAFETLFYKTFKKSIMFYPHGADSGYCPYRRHDGLNSTNQYEFIHGVCLPPSHKGEWLHRNFIDVFKREKMERCGSEFQKTFNIELNVDDSTDENFAMVSKHRTVMIKLMDSSLHNIDYLLSRTGDVNGNIIMICFMRAGPIMIDRILKVNPTADLSKLRIYCIPMPDSISRAGGQVEQRKHFENSLIEKSIYERYDVFKK